MVFYTRRQFWMLCRRSWQMFPWVLYTVQLLYTAISGGTSPDRWCEHLDTPASLGYPRCRDEVHVGTGRPQLRCPLCRDDQATRRWSVNTSSGRQSLRAFVRSTSCCCLLPDFWFRGPGPLRGNLKNKNITNISSGLPLYRPAHDPHFCCQHRRTIVGYPVTSMEAMRGHAEGNLCITCFILVPICIDSRACTIICAELTLDKCPPLVGAPRSRITSFSMVL